MLIGRETEKQQLQEAYGSAYSEFVAVYGRRRVGKTFLIRETFDYTFTFQHSGLANEGIYAQLAAFRDSLADSGLKDVRQPADWFEAFNLLAALVRQSDAGKKVVFIDEMPWMDTPRSHFVSALEHFWNGFASARKDVLLIICGSATSWMVNNVFKNHGGLHNRVTVRIHLHPFTLHECEAYAQSRGLVFSRYQLLQCYMVMGGVPLYWSYLQRGLSVDQNIDQLFFAEGGRLRHEFGELYASLFKNPEAYIALVEALGRKRMGLTRQEIVQESGLANNGKLSRVLEDLEQCDFIRGYRVFGKQHNGMVYQLKDAYTLFYFRFIVPNADEMFWTHSIGTPLRRTWEGLAFEQVCLAHVPQIKQRLGIAGVLTNAYSWRTEADEERGIDKAQIDLLIDRNDQVINLCEMKFSEQEYAISEAEERNLLRRRASFVAATHTRKAVHITMVTTYGLRRNSHWGIVQSEVVMDDLFRE